MWETKQRLDDLADLIWELDHCDDEDVTDGAPVEGGGSHGDVEADEVHGRPVVIIARTTKGKGVSFMENQPAWHGGVPNKTQFEAALAELEEGARQWQA